MEDEIERLAREELLREAKRGADRSECMGPSGWLKPRVPQTNKRFLHNTIRSTMIQPRKRPKVPVDLPNDKTDVRRTRHDNDHYHSKSHLDKDDFDKRGGYESRSKVRKNSPKDDYHNGHKSHKSSKSKQDHKYEKHKQDSFDSSGDCQSSKRHKSSKWSKSRHMHEHKS